MPISQKHVQVATYWEPETVAELDAWAAENGLSRVASIRAMVRYGLGLDAKGKIRNNRPLGSRPKPRRTMAQVKAAAKERAAFKAESRRLLAELKPKAKGDAAAWRRARAATPGTPEYRRQAEKRKAAAKKRAAAKKNPA